MPNSKRETETFAYYSKKFQRIRVDRAYGIARHKPILLLSVIELIKKGIIDQDKIYLSAELIGTFHKY